MTFAVNPEKKRTWNHGWWRDWAQGKVLIAVSVASMAGLVVTVAHALLTVDFDLAFAMGAPGQSDEMVEFIYHMMLWGLFLGLSCLIFSVIRHRAAPLKESSAESITVEDGWLTFARHITADPDPAGMRVTAARLADCCFWWDARRRQLVIDAAEPGAIAGWHTDLAHLRERPSACERVDCLRLYPFYDPDPVEYLRRAGVRERAPRSARWEL